MTAQPEFIGIEFFGKNVEAQRAARKSAAAMVSNISNETRLALRQLVARAIKEGIPPVDAARLIRSMVGLNASQAMAVMNYREAMINIGLIPSKVEKLVDRYAQRKLRERALTIARTETMQALNLGQLANWAEATKAGLIGPGAMKEWLTTADEMLCPTCSSMDGERVKLDQAFAVPGPPAHPRCRCTVALMPGKMPKSV